MSRQRSKITPGRILDVAVAALKERPGTNPLLLDGLTKIAAEYKGRDRVFDAHQENERIKAQRALWAAFPEFGPAAAGAEAMKAAFIERARELLDMGQADACDALLEFVPEADAGMMLDEYFGEDE
jgi:hypothetical protein